MDPQRVLLAGDWHGNREFAARCFAEAAAAECPVILQLGDFGLWPGREETWLDHVQACADATEVHLVWLDGNHENHDWLDAARKGAGDRPLVAMRPSVTWATRGARWEWSGRRFGALGGAVSVDRFLRRRQVNWWPQEAVTHLDVDRLGDDPLDVLATHDAPAGVSLGLRPIPLPPAIVHDIREVRSLVAQAMERTRPRLLVHGHHHRRYGAEVGGCRIEGLAHDKAEPPDGWAVLQLQPDLRVL